MFDISLNELGFDCFYAHKNPDGTPFVFEHGIEEMAERAADRERRRAQRTRASDLRRVRETLDSVGRMLHDDFEGFVAAMRAEFGDTVGDQFDLDIDDDDDDWAGEDDDDGDSWTTDDEDGLTELADDEEHDISERWFTERALAVRALRGVQLHYPFTDTGAFYVPVAS